MGLTSNHLTMKAFSEVERRFFEQDMRRVQSRLDAEYQTVGRYALDWGAWDSMFFFMEKKDPSRFDEMLDGMSLRALGLDIVIVLDSDLQPVIARTISETGEENIFSGEYLENLRQISPLLSKRAREGNFEATLFLGEKTFIAGVSPILLTNRTGEARGLLLVGADFEKKEREIAASIGTSFTVEPSAEQEVPSRSSSSIRIEPTQQGLARIQQLRECPLSPTNSLIISFTAPRPIYDEGRNAVLNSYLWIFLSGAGLLAVMMLLLDFLVLRRLSSLQSVSDRVVEEGGIQLRVPVSGRDEISTLSASFNTMLDTLEHLLSDIPNALFISDLEGKIILANKAACTAICIENSCDLKGTEVSSVLKVENIQKALLIGSASNMRTNLTFENQDIFEAQFLRTDGSNFPVEVHRKEIFFGKRPLILFLSHDLTERKTFEKRLARKAYWDDLTGLPNRYSFIEDLNRAIKGGSTSGKPLYTALINMDKFKLINAQVGNFNGDRILLIITRRLEEIIATVNGQLYRIGGDEFALLVSASSTENLRTEAEELMERIQKSIKAPCIVGDDPIFPSASIGVLLDMGRWKSSSEIMKRLMQAINNARKAGIGFTFYCSENDRENAFPDLANILLLSGEMHSALEKEEFFPFYQPIYSLPDRKIAGFETLARWNHPGRGLLLPAEFISAAEQTGFVAKIDQVMMEHAFRSINRLQNLGASRPVYFSANSSPLFFQTPSSVEIIEDFLKESGADPSLFILEVTESVLIESLKEVSRKLLRLKDSGIKIALDDFGTGYSSLQYINQLPFDYLKLDRAFVSRLIESEKDQRLLRTIINMAEDLGLEVIAEGVEREAELAWLQAAGCRKVQGYFFSKPVPWADLERMILDGK